MAVHAVTRGLRPRGKLRGSSATLIATAVCEALCGSTPIITTAMTGISSRDPGMKTVAGTPNSRKAKPGNGPAAVLRARPAGTSQRYEPDSLPSRPGPQRLQQLGGSRTSCLRGCGRGLLRVGGNHPSSAQRNPGKLHWHGRESRP